MRTDLDHLPAVKQRELERVVEMLFRGFREATENATGPRKSARILKVILFGSYARGDWVDAPSDPNEYKSDFDILVIVDQKEMTDRATYWEKTEYRLIDAFSIEKIIRTPVNFIVHTLQEVNDDLSHGRILMMEIAKDGIALYQSDDRELADPKPKTPERLYSIAQDNFDEFFPDAMRRFYLANVSYDKGWNKDTAFDYNLATDRLYRFVLMTLSLYAPHNPNILFLRGMAERLDKRLFDAWPRKTKSERAMFQKLKEAYRKAQYSKHFSISVEELDWIRSRIEVLGKIVHEVCSEHLAALKAAADATKGSPPASG